MHDPSVVPWGFVWFGLVLGVCGLALALQAKDYPRQKHFASVGGAAIVLGVAFMIVPLLVNGTIMFTKALCAVAQTAVPSADSHDDAYPQR